MDIAWVLEEIFCFLLISGYVVYFVINGIYSYPVFTHIFRADGDTPENTLDTWLSSEGSDKIKKHQVKVADWKNKCEQRLSKGLFRELRRKRYTEALKAEAVAYQFKFISPDYVETKVNDGQSYKVVKYNYDSLLNMESHAQAIEA